MSIAADLLVKLGADPSGLVAGMKTAENSVKATKLSLGDLQNLLKQLQAERPQIVDDKQLKQYNRTIDELKTNIKNLQNVGIEGFDNVGKKVEGVLGPLQGVYSGLRNIANIIPGIGIGGLVALAGEGLIFLVQQFLELNKAEKFNIDLNNEVTKGISKELGATELLVATIKDHNTSQKDKKDAIDQLIKQHPNYFKNLQDEDGVTKNLDTDLRKYIEALKDEAIIKASIAKLTELGGKLIQESFNKQQQLDNAIHLSQIGALTDLNIYTKQIIANSNERTAKIQKEIDFYINAGVAAKQALSGLGGATDTKPVTALISPDTLLKTESALKEIIKLEDDLAKPDSRPLFKRLSDSLDPSQAQLLETQIALVLRDGVKNGIDKAITTKEAGLIYEKLRKLLSPGLTSPIDTRVEVNPIVEEDVNTFEKTFPPKLYELLRKLPPIKTDIKVDPNLVLKETEFAKANAKIKEITGQIGVSLVEGFAADLGKALAGVKNPFGNIAALLGEGLEEIGKQLIIVGGLSQLIQKLLPTIFTPAGAITSIAVGALAIAAGAALKSISSTKGVKAFAEGGIVTGPTNALIGEAGPEVVFPLDKLNRFIKGNTGNNRVEVVGQTIISGPNLITVLKRAQTNQGLV